MASRIAFAFERQLDMPLAPGLYLVATPIGHLADISLRALATLAQADVVYCEDTRHSRTLVAHYAIRATLRPYHEHNAEEQRPRVLHDLPQGRKVALISRRGHAPGFRSGLQTGPRSRRRGPCRYRRSLARPQRSPPSRSPGLPTDAFFFAGFLPAKEGARKSRITELSAVPGTLVFFEAPTRIAATLADLAAELGDRDGGRRARADETA